MNLFFARTQLLGRAGVASRGTCPNCWWWDWICRGGRARAGLHHDNPSRQFWVFALLHGEGRSLFPPWEPCGNKLLAMGFPPGCELVSVTDAWSPRSWRKRSRMSMRPPISRACSTSSSSVCTTARCRLGFGCLVFAQFMPLPEST